MESDRREFIVKLLQAAAAISVSSISGIVSCSSLPFYSRKPDSNTFSALKSDRIAVVGAGAAGISAAHYLREKGYSNVVVFEERNRVGGKCSTVKIDSHYYDMGAVFTTSSYTEVIALAKQFDIKLDELEGQDPAVILRPNHSQFEAMSMSERSQLLVAASEYLFRLQKMESNLIFSPGFENLRPDLMVPFSQWIKENSISSETLEFFFGFTFTPFGYGYSSEVPAAYAIKYYEQKLVSSLIQQSSHLKKVNPGYQFLWEKVATNMNIQLNSSIEKINRVRSIEPIEIIFKDKSVEKFNSIIFTCPLEVVAKLLDCTAEETTLFNSCKYYNYHSIAIETPKGFPSTGFLPANYRRERESHPLCWLKRWDKQNIAIFYALTDKDENIQNVANVVKADLKSHGWKLGDVRVANTWKYFPHFTTADLQNKIYDKLNGLQGEEGIFIGGEIMNFSTVELTTRFSKSLIEKFY